MKKRCKRRQQESTKKMKKRGGVNRRAGWAAIRAADGAVVKGQKGWRSEHRQ